MRSVEYFGFRYPELRNTPVIVRREQFDGPTSFLGLDNVYPYDWGAVRGVGGWFGAKQLANDLTREVLGIDRCSDELRDAFLRSVILRLPRIGWSMTAEAVEWWATLLTRKGEVLQYPFTGIEELRPPPRDALAPNDMEFPARWLDHDLPWEREDDMKDLEEEQLGNT